LIGKSGVGKTTLLQSSLQHLTGLPINLPQLAARCTPCSTKFIVRPDISVELGARVDISPLSRESLLYLYETRKLKPASIDNEVKKALVSAAGGKQNADHCTPEELANLVGRKWNKFFVYPGGPVGLVKWLEDTLQAIQLPKEVAFPDTVTVSLPSISPGSFEYELIDTRGLKKKGDIRKENKIAGEEDGGVLRECGLSQSDIDDKNSIYLFCNLLAAADKPTPNEVLLKFLKQDRIRQINYLQKKINPFLKILFLLLLFLSCTKIFHVGTSKDIKRHQRHQKTSKVWIL
jgi:GTPase SAR1 family protein